MPAVSSMLTVPPPSSPNIPPFEPRHVCGSEFYAHHEVLVATTVPASIGKSTEECVKGNILNVTCKPTGT